MQRSKSVPHVSPLLRPPHNSIDREISRSKIPRHSSAITLSTLTCITSQPQHPVDRDRVEHISPLVERGEDPFNLSGFFSLSITEKQREAEWDWLRGDDAEDRSDEAWPDIHSGSTSPLSEDLEEDWMPSTPPHIFNHLISEREDETITKDDIVHDVPLTDQCDPFDQTIVDGGLLSPYCEDPVDCDALYSGLCAVRKAHTRVRSDDLRGRVTAGGLFSSNDIGIDEELECGGMIYDSLRRMIEILPL
ncbi:hypothetical protein ABKN59_000856 [Abortiporus biennis]